MINPVWLFMGSEIGERNTAVQTISKTLLKKLFVRPFLSSVTHTKR